MDVLILDSPLNTEILDCIVFQKSETVKALQVKNIKQAKLLANLGMLSLSSLLLL